MLEINSQSEKDRIIHFLKNTFTKTGLDQVMLGLSGGIDSATILYLLKETLPLDHIHIAHLHYYDTFQPQIKELLTQVKVPSQNILNLSIKPLVDRFINTFDTKKDKIRTGNIMARVRMILLFDLAKKYNGLVCGTENKSEHLLGYFTRFGDEASDIEPIRHLYKTQIKKLAQHLRVPQNIIDQAPTAGLWQGQTDEGQFGFSYEEADQVMSLYYDEKKALKNIQKRFKNAEKIIRFTKSSSFKHEVPYSL